MTSSKQTGLEINIIWAALCFYPKSFAFCIFITDSYCQYIHCMQITIKFLCHTDAMPNTLPNNSNPNNIENIFFILNHNYSTFLIFLLTVFKIRLILKKCIHKKYACQKLKINMEAFYFWDVPSFPRCNRRIVLIKFTKVYNNRLYHYRHLFIKNNIFF